MIQFDLVMLLLALIGFVLLVSVRRKPRPPTDRIPRNAIVVDGSNVMHWGGDPSAKVLSRVLRALEAKGHTPIVFFDASVGYRLSDRYLHAEQLSKMIGIPATQVSVVDKGVVADQAILAFSADHGLRIVSNDQYRDWRVQFPHLDRKGAVLRGTFQDGAVVWRKPLELVRG